MPALAGRATTNLRFSASQITSTDLLSDRYPVFQQGKVRGLTSGFLIHPCWGKGLGHRLLNQGAGQLLVELAGLG